MFKQFFTHLSFYLFLFLVVLFSVNSFADNSKLFPSGSLMIELQGDDTTVLYDQKKMDSKLKALVKKYGKPQITQSFKKYGKDQQSIAARIAEIFAQYKLDLILSNIGMKLPETPPLHRLYTLKFSSSKFDINFAIKKLSTSKNFARVTVDWMTKLKSGENGTYAWTDLSWFEPYAKPYVPEEYQKFLVYLQKVKPIHLSQFLVGLEEASTSVALTAQNTITLERKKICVCHMLPESRSSAKGEDTKALFVPGVLLVTLWDDNDAIFQDEAIAQIFALYGQPQIEQRFALLGKTYDEVKSHHEKILQKFSQRSQRRISGIDVPPLNRLYKLTFPDTANLNEILIELCRTNKFKEISPDYYLHVNTVPDDPYYSSAGSWSQSYDDLWGLKQIDAETAWDVTTGDANMVIGVIDTGIDFTHTDITNNIYTNSAETNGNSNDDDLNGYVDDAYGYDFENSDNDSTDDHGHGTHVSGTIAAEGDNSTGVVGVMWQAKIMPLKVCDADGSCSIATIDSALVYGTDMGVEVVNISLGGQGSYDDSAYLYAYSLGVVLVAASGNDYDSCSEHYPSAFWEVFAVGSSTTSDEKSEFSNGCEELDVVAPGGDDSDSSTNDIYHNILSLKASRTDMYGDGVSIVDTNYYRARGTSMATPHVTGAIGLILSNNPTLSVEEVRQVLRMTADDIGDSGWDSDTAYGRLNVGNAVNSTTHCEALITSPDIYEVERDINVSVVGYINGDDFASYELKFYRGTDSSGTLLATSTGSTAMAGENLLGTVTAYYGINSTYVVYLTVYDSAGNICGQDFKPFIYTSQTEVVDIEDVTGRYIGYTLATGDVNGDGNKELLMGAPNKFVYAFYSPPTIQGEVYLVSSGYPYTAIENDVSDTTLVPVSWIGDSIDDLVGVRIVALDIDGDATDDVVIAAPGDSGSAQYAGKICFFLGKNYSTWTRDMLLSNADYCFTGEAEQDFLRGALSKIGDMDSDRIDDLAVSSCGNDSAGTDYGSVYILYSSDLSSWSNTQSIASGAGTKLAGVKADPSCNYDSSDSYLVWGDKTFSLSGGGDFNGDGVQDFVIGNSKANSFQGGAYIFSATAGKITSGSLTDAPIQFEFSSNSSLGYFGQTVLLDSDYNGDALADLVVSGNPGFLSATADIKVINGSGSYSGTYEVSDLSVTTLTESYNTYQESLVSLGDYNGDGYNDFAIGSPWASFFSNPGTAFVYFGGASSPTSGSFRANADLVLKDQDEAGYFYGYSVVPWDFDNDGDTEIVVGAAIGGNVYIMDNEKYVWTGGSGCSCDIANNYGPNKTGSFFTIFVILATLFLPRVVLLVKKTRANLFINPCWLHRLTQSNR